MSERIHELLHRNLQEVFGEGDAGRRRAAIEALYTEDCVLYAPPGIFAGPGAPVCALFPRYRQMPTRVRLFVDALAAHLGEFVRANDISRPIRSSLLAGRTGSVKGILANDVQNARSAVEIAG